MSDGEGLRRLLQPESLAVIGASRNPAKWGHRVIRNTLQAGFRGQVFAVNPGAGGKEVAGAPSVAHVQDVPGTVDCVLVAVPAAAVEDAIGQCAAAGVGAAVIAASGFAETGKAGRAIQHRIEETARSAGLRILGPNGFGLFRAEVGLLLTPHDDLPAGHVALLTQSGNVALAIADMARRSGIGFSICVGIGNQLDVSFGELLAWAADDPATTAIGLYVEGIPTNKGDAFVAGLDRCVAAGKLVAVLKAGRSVAGTSVAATHTAALASDDRVWEAVLASHGAVRVTSTEEMVDVLLVAKLSLGRGRVAVVTDGGGDSVMAADAVAKSPLALATLAPLSQEKLEDMLPPVAPRSPGLNPLTIDTPGGMDDDPRLVARCVDVLASDPNVDMVLVGGVLGGYVGHREQELEATAHLVEASASMPIVVQSAYTFSGGTPIATLRRGGIPLFPTMERLVRAVSARVARAGGEKEESVATTGMRWGAAGEKVLPVAETFALLSGVGVDLPPTRVVSDADSLSEAIGVVGLPICVKLADPAIAHKSDVGGVQTGLASDEAVERAATGLWKQFPGSPLMLMPSFAPGVELVVGAFSDPLFGPAALIGRGGIWVELEADTAIVVGPTSPDEIRGALRHLRIWPVLAGSRGQPELNVHAVCKLSLSLVDIVRSDPALTVEVNPVILSPNGCALADIRVQHR